MPRHIGRFRQSAFRLLGGLSIFAGLVGLLAPFLEAVVWIDVKPQSIEIVGGNAYQAVLGSFALTDLLLDRSPDTNENPQRSGAVLREQGVSLDFPHSSHSEISGTGLGRYSHWSGAIYFSTSDNSDPRTNGRTYTIGYPVAPSIGFCVFLLIAGRILLARNDASLLAPRIAQELTTASITLGLLALILYIFPAYVSKTIDSSSIRHADGNAYVANLPSALSEGWIKKVFGAASDSSASPSQSRLRLFEEGARIGIAHSMHSEIADKGMARFSHWGAEIVFSATDNTNPKMNGRQYSVAYPIAPPWWLPIALILSGGIALRISRGPFALPPTSRMTPIPGMDSLKRSGKRILTTRNLLLASMLLIAASDNWIFHKIVSAPTPSPDTASYLGWSLARTVGYPALLEGYQYVFDSWDWLALMQLNIVLLGIFVLSVAIAEAVRSYFAGWVFLVLAHGAGAVLLSANSMLTEAVFSGLAMLHLGFMILFIRNRGLASAALAGLTIAAAVLIKSVAVVFLGPLTILLISLSGSFRRTLFLAVFCPTLAAFIVPSAFNYSKNGIFETSVLGGYAFAGHVGWAIRPYSGSSFPEEARLIESQLQPLLDKRPNAFQSWGDYVEFTLNEYNPILYGHIIPAVASYHNDICRKDQPQPTWHGAFRNHCLIVLNKILLDLSKEAILHNPEKYLQHVAYHYWGLWKFVFSSQDFLQGIIAASEFLPAAYRANNNYYLNLLHPKPFPETPELAEAIGEIEDHPLRALQDILLFRQLTGKFIFDKLRDFAELVIVASLIGSLGFYWLMKRHPAAAAFSYTALMTNAYFLGHALAQPAMERYAATMQGVAIAMLVLGAYTLTLPFRSGHSSSANGNIASGVRERMNS